MFVVVSVLVYSVRAARDALAARAPTAHETPFEPLPEAAS